MRSESEVRWVRVKNNIGQRTATSDWHSIVPGMGVDAPPPGVSCGTALTGSRVFEPHSGIAHQPGVKHPECVENAANYIADIPPNPGPRAEDPEWVTFAEPGKGGYREADRP